MKEINVCIIPLNIKNGLELYEAKRIQNLKYLIFKCFLYLHNILFWIKIYTSKIRFELESIASIKSDMT